MDAGADGRPKGALTAIYKTNFGSGTSLYEAVAAVSELEQMKATGRKAMVIFTDGVDTTSRMAVIKARSSRPKRSTL